jgi:glycogen debranching enzyme
MPLEIRIGPPHLVVHEGQTVWVSEPDGQVGADGTKGLLFRDTRLISYWRVYANGQEWDLISGGAISHYAARVFLTNRTIVTEDGDIPPRTLGLTLGRWLSGGVHEDLDVTNYGRREVRFNLEVSIRSDFADLFEIKEQRLVRRGRTTTEWLDAEQCLRTTYVNQDFRRGINIRMDAEGPAVYANGRLSFEVALAPGASWHACLLHELVDDYHAFAPPGHCMSGAEDSPASASLIAWRSAALKLRSSNEEVYRLFAQAVDDIAALRTPVEIGGETYVAAAAGLPWFVALFGRDSLIVSLQTAPVSIEFARGTLELLGRQQSRELDNFRDAEPGKILHEMRRGELAHFKLIPHTPYYGSADATMLYLMVLHATWRWTGDRALVERHLETAERCVTWIDQYGDRDGDGFQEYQTRSPRGYENMGWKDAGDAVLYPDGSLVKGPKALCELQGYVYAAWLGMAELYAMLGDAARAADLRRRAAELFNRFNEVFWDEDWGFYAYALDGDKKPVRTVVSNVGHCLWTGIIRHDRARRVVERLLQPDMFSGWGIRTLSAQHPAFNPHSYHNGSVWPHDNGLIALGFKRYGFAAEAARVARAISGAGSFFAQHQMPELFAGIQRNAHATDFPVQYLGANVPQAWAAGSAFSFIQAILGLVPDAANERLYVDPVLPHWLPDVTLQGLRVGPHVFDLRFQQVEDTAEFEVLRGPPDAVIQATPASGEMRSVV